MYSLFARCTLLALLSCASSLAKANDDRLSVFFDDKPGQEAELSQIIDSATQADPSPALDDEVLPAPTLVSPVARAAIQSGETVTVTFAPVPGATAYQAQLFDRALREWSAGPVVRVDLSCIDPNGTCAATVDAADPNTLYGWRARTRNDQGWGPWSSTAYFYAFDLNAAAARFVQMADFDVADSDLEEVLSDGPEAWLDRQLQLAPPQLSRFEWMDLFTDRSFHYLGFDNSTWNRLFTAESGVKERWVLALSEIFVINVRQTAVGGLRGFGGAAYLDSLETYGFGTFRQLLREITLNHQMGSYLSLLNSRKANGEGREPDENYAREVLQLFSIGLLRLQINGNPVLDGNGNEIETYTNDDITTLAAALTGWQADFQGVHPNISSAHYQRHMQMVDSDHQEGPLPKLMGRTIDNSSGEAALESVLDIIANHPNVGPFMASQLIKRLVTSNPSPSYIARVARVFNDDGNGVRGNLTAVLKAILLDREALNIDFVPTFPGYPGKLREPMIRFIQWGRTFKFNDPTGEWPLTDLSNEGTELGQSPLHSPSVFNFFRPGFVAPNTDLANLGLTAPELQITTEVSTIGYANYMYRLIVHGHRTIKPDYTYEISLAENPQALVDRLNLVLTANQLSNETVDLIVDTLESMPDSSTGSLRRRVHAAILMIMVSPDYLVLR